MIWHHRNPRSRGHRRKIGPQRPEQIPELVLSAMKRVIASHRLRVQAGTNLTREADREIEADLALIMRWRDPARWVWFMTMFPALRSAPQSTHLEPEEDEIDEQ
jgi:hypothetical protein